VGQGEQCLSARTETPPPGSMLVTVLADKVRFRVRLDSEIVEG
jgi:hypothetical protein